MFKTARVNKNRVLLPEQILQVHEYSLRLLEEIGCKVQSNEAQELLRAAGCSLDDDCHLRIPRNLVMEAIESSPKSIKVFGRDGELSMELKEGFSYYGAGSDCPTTIDLETGRRRTCLKSDIERLSRFSDALPNIDFVMSFGIANDAPKGSNFVHQYEAMLKNTVKPIIVTAHGRNDMLTIIDMASAVIGGKKELAKRPPLILYTEPLSPLTHTEMGVNKALVCCDHDIPVIYIGSPMMGATSPVSLEATLVQTVAETLSGLVILQRKRAGSKFIFGGDASVLDMRTTIFAYGAPEVNIFNEALADMAHHYNLPFFCMAGATDSKVLDAQAGFEYAMSIYNATLNGCNIIHDCGYLESGLTSSFESLLMADEVISNIAYTLQGLRFDEETVGLPVIQKGMKEGSFLTLDHTIKHYRNILWFPQIMDRDNYENWEKKGRKDLRQALASKAKEILDKHQIRKIPEQKERMIDEIVAKHQADVGA